MSSSIYSDCLWKYHIIIKTTAHHIQQCLPRWCETVVEQPSACLITTKIKWTIEYKVYCLILWYAKHQWQHALFWCGWWKIHWVVLLQRTNWQCQNQEHPMSQAVPGVLPPFCGNLWTKQLPFELLLLCHYLLIEVLVDCQCHLAVA